MEQGASRERWAGVKEPGCEVSSVSLCLGHYLRNLLFLFYEMELCEAQINLE